MFMLKSKSVSLIYGYSEKNAGDFAITLGAIDVLLHTGFHVRLFSRYCSKNRDYHESKKSLVERYGNKIEIFESPFNLDRTDNLLRTLINYAKGLGTFWGINQQSRFKKKLLNSDLIIFNGGNLFRCSSFIDFTRLIALIYPLRIAQKAKVPYLIFPQSASTINYVGKYVLKPILQKAQMVMVREKESYKYLQSFVDNKNFIQTIDLAYFIDKSKLKYIDKNYNGYVAFTLRFHTIGDISYLTEDKLNKICFTIGDIIDAVKKSHKVLIVVQTKKDEELSRKLAIKHNVELLICYNVPTLISIYKQVSLLIGMRLHSMILALSVGTPCIGLFYKEWGLKNPGLMKYFDMPFYFFEESIEPEKIIADIEKIIRNKEQYTQRINAIIKEEESKLYESIRNIESKL